MQITTQRFPTRTLVAAASGLTLALSAAVRPLYRRRQDGACRSIYGRRLLGPSTVKGRRQNRCRIATSSPGDTRAFSLRIFLAHAAG